MTEYERWLNQPLDDPDLTEELQSIQGQEEEINDRFYMLNSSLWKPVVQIT